MSGFFGTVRTDGTAVEPRFLEKVAQQLRFRGPDGGQTWSKDGLGACFAYWRPGRATNPAASPYSLGDDTRSLVKCAWTRGKN